MVDMVYGMLHLNIRESLPRDKVSSFKDLIDQARVVEHNMKEKEIQANGQPDGNLHKDKRIRCNFC
jgi:hypothetical protein